MVIKIGGCGGSGKTYFMRALMERWKFQPMEIWENGKSYLYIAALSSANGLNPFQRVQVLGSYETACGGLDTVHKVEDRLSLVQRYGWDPSALTVFEGLLTGKSYGAMGQLGELQTKVGSPWLYFFLDTPFEVCIQRIQMRRDRRGTTTEFNPERSLRSNWHACHNTVPRYVASKGFPVFWLDHRQSGKQQVNTMLKIVENYGR